MAVEKAIASSSLVEVVDRILDKGVVIGSRPSSSTQRP